MTTKDAPLSRLQRAVATATGHDTTVHMANVRIRVDVADWAGIDDVRAGLPEQLVTVRHPEQAPGAFIMSARIDLATGGLRRRTAQERADRHRQGHSGPVCNICFYARATDSGFFVRAASLGNALLAWEACADARNRATPTTS